MTEEIFEKVRQIKAMLAAITGSQGVEEMEDDDLNAYLSVCHSLAAEALAMAQPAQG